MTISAASYDATSFAEHTGPVTRAFSGDITGSVPIQASTSDHSSDGDVFGPEVKVTVNRSIPNMRQDSELEEFTTFIGSGDFRSASAYYSEDWMRPIENFPLKG